MIYFLDY